MEAWSSNHDRGETTAFCCNSTMTSPIDEDDPWYDACECEPGQPQVSDQSVPAALEAPNLCHDGRQRGWLVRQHLRVECVLLILCALQQNRPSCYNRWVENCKVLRTWTFSSLFDCSGYFKHALSIVLYLPLERAAGLTLPRSLHISTVCEKVPWRVKHCIKSSDPDCAVLDVHSLTEVMVPNVKKCQDARLAVGVEQYPADLGQWTIAGSDCRSLSKKNSKRHEFANTMMTGDGVSGESFHGLMNAHRFHDTMILTWEMVFQ